MASIVISILDHTSGSESLVDYVEYSLVTAEEVKEEWLGL